MSNVKVQIPKEYQSSKLKHLTFGVGYLFDLWILKFELLPIS